MPITHTFVSAKVDGGDATLVRASNWNADHTITALVDADISATAEIAVSKLADGTARQLLQTDAAGTGVEWASNIDIPGTLDVTGAAVFDSLVTAGLAGVGLGVTQDAYVGGYLRVGSSVAPANTTAGDITGVRLTLGNSTFSSSTGRIGIFGLTNTDTAAGNSIMLFATQTIDPASNSSSAYRALNFLNTVTPATGITVNSVTGIFVNNQLESDALVTSIRGIGVEGLVLASVSAATTSATTVTGMSVLLVNRTGGTSTVTITTGIGFDFTPTNTASLVTATTIIGFRVLSGASNTYTTFLGIDIGSINRAATTNVGVRIAHPSLVIGIGNTTDSIGLAIPASAAAMSDQTATTTNAHGISIGIATYTSTTNTRTLTNAASLYIAGAPVASTNVTITNGPFSIWVDAGNVRFDGTILSNNGAQTICAANGNLASANGANFGPAAPASITVVNGIVTAVS